ncbi:NEDD8 transferase [Aureococcus anophagefferens]|uniref:UBC core domain-containing protein n=1 Tax=Aureococcus anophagefferens TaxID=44056 RepID=F0YAW6_AURAN|nr:hypothetical protein AURANDRAFT_53859 [Aureococcus anophagefferens]EGB07605.1 hypothetical protein AURANDRAFT_53859 [Aureococcus anophagefferens]KAH8053822.1 NEDD8 transferase [Aureococcus anophagefferens]|mmetsp:Transcript_13457/g.46157  ORF Transcript_13457/g.46157 Transcript_13457/m.46157 type:complete len:200 (-) Transcript_13457:145-744(-)|eukprot:XP_009037603.1 hypothetical protein AURANDRAFT_53859 [Aureococcus anophagefferens]
MIRLKKKSTPAPEPTAAKADEAMPDAAPAEGEKEKVSILGIGGKKMSKGTGSKKRKTPGEIRIQKDIAELDGGDVAVINFPNANDLTKFHVVVTPDTGFWKGATYHFTFSIPAMYPHEPPKVHCDTKIFHPNINLEGNVCLNILRQDWKPVLDINAVIYGLIYLFYEPNPDDPLNKEAAALYRDDIKMFERHVARTLPR